MSALLVSLVGAVVLVAAGITVTRRNPIHAVLSMLVALGGAVFFGARLGPATILALVIGVSGVVTLCVAGDAHDAPAQTNTLRGVLLQVGSAVGFAAHILLLSHYGGRLATAPFTFWQLAR